MYDPMWCTSLATLCSTKASGTASIMATIDPLRTAAGLPSALLAPSLNVFLRTFPRENVHRKCR